MSFLRKRAAGLIGIVVIGACAVAGCRGEQLRSQDAVPATGAPTSQAASVRVPSSVTTSVPATTDPNRWCTGRDLKPKVDERASPDVDSRLFELRLVAREGVGCVLGGSLSDVGFYGADGAPIPIEIAGGQNAPTATVDLADGREAVVYISAPKLTGPGKPVQSIRFVLPGKETRGETVEIGWPAPFDGPAHITNITEPMS